MSSKQWKIIIGLNLLLATPTMLPFLPGPVFLYSPAQFFFSIGTISGIPGLFIVASIFIIWIVRKFKTRKKEGSKKTGLITVLLLTLFTIPFLTSIFLSRPLRNMSRKIAIARTDTMISAIEDYKRDKGIYPDKLEELKQEYLSKILSPLIIGIPEYGYENTGQSYRITFKQNVIMGFNFEIVAYDPTDRHKAIGEIQELYDCGIKHWKYYIYD